MKFSLPHSSLFIYVTQPCVTFFDNDVVYCRFQTKMAACLHQALVFYDLTGNSETVNNMEHCTKPKEEF